jgi:sulfur carrier protein
MTIYVNDESTELKEDTNLQTLIDSTKIKRKKGIAVAVDNQVIPRNQWEHYYLKNNSKVVIIQATQGG